MREWAGTAITDDALRVKWLDFLLLSVRRLLKVFKAFNLNEQATRADELIFTDPSVYVVGAR